MEEVLLILSFSVFSHYIDNKDKIFEKLCLSVLMNILVYRGFAVALNILRRYCSLPALE